jgi:hypothetical protein
MLVQLERSRVVQAAILDTTKREIDRIETALLAAMHDSGTTIYASSNATVEVKPRRVFKAADWEALFAHMGRTGEWDLVQRRLSSTALHERGDALPPGVVIDTFNEIKFSLKGE